MNIQFTLAARYLMGRKLRAFLTTLAVTFGVMIIFGLNSVIPAMSMALRQNIIISAGKVDLSVAHVAGASFSPAILEAVRGVPGVAQASGLLRRNLLLPASLSRSTDPLRAVNAITLTGLDPQTAQRIRSYPAASGRFLQEGDQDVAALPESLARKLNLAVGDTLILPSFTGTANLKIIGLLALPAAPGVEEVYVPLPVAQKVLNLPGQINTVEALFAPGVDRAQVEAAVQSKLGDSYKLAPLEFGNELLASLRVGEIAMNLFGLLALAMGGFIIFNTFRTVLAERRHDLGMLRALGASRRAILGISVAESLIQGVLGTAIGMLAGYLFSAALLAIMKPIGKEFLHAEFGWPRPTLFTVVEAILLGVGITLAGGLVPALSASKVTPLDALRPLVGSGYERMARRHALIGGLLIALALLGLLSGVFNLAALGTLLFLSGLVLVAPVLVKPLANIFGRLLHLIFAREGQIAQGNLARQPGRAAITASAMMIGLAITIALFGVVSSIREGFLSYLDRSLGADLLIMPYSLVLGGGNLGAAPELAEKLRGTPGIAAVTTLRLGASEAKGGALQVIGIEPQSYAAVAGLIFSQGDAAQAYAALHTERAIILNGIFAAQHGAKVGDALTLKTAEGNKQYKVVGIGLDYLNAKLATAYISQANLASDFHQTNDALLMANLAKGADAAAVRRSLAELIAGYPAFSLLDSATFRQSQEATFDSAMGMLYAMALAFALPALIAMVNTLAINVIERTREIGVLRAVGSTRKQVQRMILAESLLLAAAGSAFGILAGLWLGYVLTGAMSVAGFVVSYYFPYAGILASAAVGLLFGALAATIPARQAARMDIIAALRSE